MEHTSGSEIWKPLNNFPKTYLSNKGNLKKVYLNKEVPKQRDGNRYNLSLNGKIHHLRIKLIMEQYFPNDPYTEVEETIFENLDGEEWRDIPNLEGLYQVSNMNRARRLDSYRDFRDSKMFIKGGICSLSLNRKGYLVFGINTNGKPRTRLLHRMVGFAFIPNPDNLPEINHINGIKTDCTPTNLEWCTTAHNLQHAWDTGLRKRKNSKQSKLLKENKS